MIHDPALVKLGRKPPRLDRRTLRLARYMLPGLPAPKPSIDWTSSVARWGDYGNNEYGDCTLAAAAHMQMAWSANASAESAPDPSCILSLYRQLSPQDQGLVELDVLNLWRQQGICGGKIAAFGAVNYRSLDEVKLGIEWFGGLYAGVILPMAAQNQEVWDIAANDGGVWGAHAVPLLAYGLSDLLSITWGEVKRLTWAWLSMYTEELWACISSDWLNSQGKTPEGLDIETLAGDLEKVTA